ncbi:unnamed protein product [Effrenium voratum]|uniref:Uncharacterized protein n=1 Tax=Effrenium voratum TaxID=2562239 RepID=A0AA36J0T5_9DINO|nr:unnamed protein product [Effrenium voratum]
MDEEADCPKPQRMDDADDSLLVGTTSVGSAFSKGVSSRPPLAGLQELDLDELKQSLQRLEETVVGISRSMASQTSILSGLQMSVEMLGEARDELRPSVRPPAPAADPPAILAVTPSMSPTASKEDESTERRTSRLSEVSKLVSSVLSVPMAGRRSSAPAVSGVRKICSSGAYEDSLTARKSPALGQFTQWGMMEELEMQTAKQIFRTRVDRRHKSRSTSRESRHVASFRRQSSKLSKASRVAQVVNLPLNDTPLNDTDGVVTQELKKTAKARSVTQEEHRQETLSKCRRMSLDELRNNYDAVIVRATTGTMKNSSPMRTVEGSTALPLVAWVCLCMAGLLDIGRRRQWRLLSFWNYAIFPTLATGALLWSASADGLSTYMASSLGSLILGLVLATCSLRRAGLTSLLGPEDCRLDEYATESGFMMDWQKVSLRRFCQVLAVWLTMVACRVLSSCLYASDVIYGSSITGQPTFILCDAVYMSMAFYCSTLTFCQLHICSGLELAIDSFGLNFFKDMDMETAVQEWNLVQAMLRQVSHQTSGALFILGASSATTILLLAEQILRQPDVIQDTTQVALWIGWLYPPTLLFFVTMLRAAAVTEKASRVAPLINSWTFQAANSDDSSDEGWMDLERHYIVQYINQSEAGFYMKGVRVTSFDVQKIGYYFAAFTFTLFSRFL